MYRTEPPNPDPALQQKAEADGTQAEAALVAKWVELDADLNGRDWFCEDFSVADIAMFMTLVFARRLSAPPWDTLENLNAWFTRMESRPAPARAAAETAAADRELSPQK